MSVATCSVQDCNRPARTRGWCATHYRRWLRRGDLLARPRQSPEHFWERTTPAADCVVWTAAVSRKGYGIVNWDGRPKLAHRVAFFLRMGRWPEGLLRHLCNNPRCVLHAVEGTPSENMLDAVAAGRLVNASRTHCPAGHPYDEENTRVCRRGFRHCRACNRIRSARRRSRP